MFFSTYFFSETNVRSGSSRFRSWSHSKSQANTHPSIPLPHPHAAQPPLTCAALVFIAADTGDSGGPARIPGAPPLDLAGRRGKTKTKPIPRNVCSPQPRWRRRLPCVCFSWGHRSFTAVRTPSSTGTSTFLARKRLAHAMPQRTHSQKETSRLPLSVRTGLGRNGR